MLDFMSLWDCYTDKEKKLCAGFKGEARETLRPYIKDSHRDSKAIRGIVKTLGQMKVYAPYIDGYGCLGSSMTSYGLIMAELERLDSGVRSVCSVQGALCMGAIYKFGTEEQKQKYLEKLSRGEIIGAFALTEPLYGSDPGGMTTEAVKDGDTYVLNGEKHWITNAVEADVVIVWAKLDKKVRGFIVDTKLKGYESKKIEGKFSLRTSNTGSIKLNNLRLSKDAILEKSYGLKSPLSCLNDARFGIAFGATGAAEDCYKTALNYVQNRQIFKGPLSGFSWCKKNWSRCLGILLEPS